MAREYRENYHPSSPFSTRKLKKYGKHSIGNHVLYVYISAYFPPEGGGCYQALDAVTYQASFPGTYGRLVTRYLPVFTFDAK
jgi:hypothetical protein